MPRNKLLPQFLHNATTVRTRGYLPHWETDAAIYSITYRLYDSLPLHVVEALFEERRALIRSVTGGIRELRLEEKQQIAHLFGMRLDHHLDQGLGSCYLRIHEIASIVAGNLRYFNETRYQLFAWCVMPNHVHVIVRLNRGSDLPSVVHSWKSYTAKRANGLLGREGPFWQREYFDRIVRDAEDLEMTRRYVLQNPLKAGMRDWKWVWVSGDVWPE